MLKTWQISGLVYAFLLVVVLTACNTSTSTTFVSPPTGGADKPSDALTSFTERVTEELRTSWQHFTVATFGEKLLGIVLLLVMAVPVTIVSFIVGPVLFPLEIVVFLFLAIATQNFYWLTMIITWKYALLFSVVF